MKQDRMQIARWIALAAILLNTGFNFLSERLLPHGDIKAITEKHGSLFTPAGYAFSIWGVIYTSFILYGIYQLLPSQRAEKLYDRISLPLILVNILASVWIIVFRDEMLGLSVLVILTTLAVALVMYTRIRAAVLKDGYNTWISAPFSLFAGWISVASIANISIWLAAMGWRGGQWGEITWTTIMVIAAGVLGVLVSYRFRDLIFPLVVAWACVAIFVARNLEYHKIATTAMASAITLVIAIILLLGVRRHQRLAAEKDHLISTSQF